MAWDLWSSSFDQVYYDDNYSEILEWHCDYFGCGRDEIEEDALNVASCVQVLRILLTKADNEIEELEKDLMCLQNELAWTENENWPEICCSALTDRINRLDVAVTNLKSDRVDDADMQLLLHSEPAETVHEIVKALHKDHCQDTHGQTLDENIQNPIVNVTEPAPDKNSNNIDSNAFIKEGGEEDFGTSENSISSELPSELHEKSSDDPEKTEELLAISLVGNPDLGVVSCVPQHSDRMILSDTLDDKVTGDEDVRQSQLVTTDTCQILTPFLSKEENITLIENVCSDDYKLAIIKRSTTTESGQILDPFLSKGNKNIPSETKEVNIYIKENVCSDGQIKGSLLIAKNVGQILNPFSSKGNGNIPSEAKKENTNLKGNVCSDDYRLPVIKRMKMYSHSRLDTGHQEDNENSDLAKKLCDLVPKNARRACRKEAKVAPDEDSKSLYNFVPKSAQRACRKESKVAPDEDLDSMNVPLQIVHPQNTCFADTESSAFKENNGNNALQVIKFEKATLNTENSVSLLLPGMQTKNVLCTRLQPTDEGKPQAQDLKSKVSVNFGKANKRFPSKLKSQGKKTSEFEACSAKELFPVEAFPNTSKNVTTKRQRKPKNEFLNSKITKRAVHPGQLEIVDLSDSDDVSTKRQRKPNTFTAGTILNELVNRKITKRSVQTGQHETNGNAIVLYDREFSELQKKRRVSELSITSEVQNPIVNYLGLTNSDRVSLDNGSQYDGKSLALVDSHNESSALLPITSTETFETLMKKTLPVLKDKAKQLNMTGYCKFRKSVLVEEIIKRLSIGPVFPRNLV